MGWNFILLIERSHNSNYFCYEREDLELTAEKKAVWYLYLVISGASRVHYTKDKYAVSYTATQDKKYHLYSASLPSHLE